MKGYATRERYPPSYLGNSRMRFEWGPRAGGDPLALFGRQSGGPVASLRLRCLLGSVGASRLGSSAEAATGGAVATPPSTPEN